MSVVVPRTRMESARLRRQARDEQAFIEACERGLAGRPRDMGELIDRAKARMDRERGR